MLDKKFVFQVIGLILIIFAGLLLTENPHIIDFLTGPPPPKYQKIDINGNIFKVEIADTDALRTKGLGGRSYLATDSGMLFIFNDLDVHRFWMKDMRIPLDFLWIRDDKIVDLIINVAPPAPKTPDSALTIYQPSEPINKVLELNAGAVNRFGIKIGDTIKVVK